MFSQLPLRDPQGLVEVAQFEKRIVQPPGHPAERLAQFTQFADWRGREWLIEVAVGQSPGRGIQLPQGSADRTGGHPAEQDGDQ